MRRGPAPLDAPAVVVNDRTGDRELDDRMTAAA